MPRSSLSALEVLIRRLKADEGLTGHPEVRANLLSRTRGLQRRGLGEDEVDGAVLSVLLRRDVLLASGVTTPEAMNLRVRQSEQLNKLRSALRRRDGVASMLARPRKMFIPQKAARPSEEDEVNDDAADCAAGGSDVDS